MNTYLVWISLLALLFLSGCMVSKGVTDAPCEVEPLCSRDNEEEICHDYMSAIVSAAIIFFAENGYYPATLDELGTGYSNLHCPTCGLSYDYKGDSENITVFCPLPFSPNHGGIVNGVATWPPDPGSYQAYCRAQMRTISSQEVIYFAMHSEYTESLEALGLEDLTCPQCGSTYILEINETKDQFWIQCPLQDDPNHGKIENGVASWE